MPKKGTQHARYSYAVLLPATLPGSMVSFCLAMQFVAEFHLCLGESAAPERISHVRMGRSIVSRVPSHLESGRVHNRRYATRRVLDESDGKATRVRQAGGAVLDQLVEVGEREGERPA